MKKKKIRTTTKDQRLKYITEMIEEEFKDAPASKTESDSQEEPFPGMMDESLEKILKESKEIDDNISRNLRGNKYLRLLPYLELDLWDEEEGLMLITGLDPLHAEIDYSYDNHVGVEIKNPVVHRASPFDVSNDIGDYPSRRAMHEEKDELENKLQNHESFGVSESELQNLEKRLVNTQKFIDNLHSKSVWRIWRNYSTKLSEVYRLWHGSKHPDARKHPKEYFVEWALEWQIDVYWLGWAQAKGFFVNIQQFLGENSESEADQQFKSDYLTELQFKSDILINKYPLWRNSIGINNIQNTASLIEWIMLEVSVNTREADIIKKVLIERFPELKKR